MVGMIVGNSPKYLTWDKTRLGWVFQIRVPDYARTRLEGKTTIRERLKETDAPSAAAAAELRASHYKNLFKQYEPSTKKRGSQASEITVVEFIIDGDICRRFVATWKSTQCAMFEERYIALRNSPHHIWDEWENEVADRIRDAREQARRHQTSEFKAALEAIESRLHIRHKGNLDSLIQHFNAARVRFLEECLDAIRGEIPVCGLYPDITEQLPLIDLWGTPAAQVPEHWASRVDSTCSLLNLRTMDKYKNICKDLARVMKRRPVEMITHADLRALTTLWSARKNKPTTINDKLAILQSLLAPFIQDERLNTLFKQMFTGIQEPRAARKAFTDTNTQSITVKLLNDPSVRTDDVMLWNLMNLLGTRLEETYQLTANDFEADDHGWIVRFADHRQTGSGTARLKNARSARHLPLRRGTIPALDEWLTARLAAGGYLFPDGSQNKYNTRSSAASKRINRRIRLLFPDDNRLVLQSTRCTANKIMREADIDTRLRRRTLGHTCNNAHDKHYDHDDGLDGCELRQATDSIADRKSKLLYPATKRPAALFNHIRAAATWIRSIFAPQ